METGKYLLLARGADGIRVMGCFNDTDEAQDLIGFRDNPGVEQFAIAEVVMTVGPVS